MALINECLKVSHRLEFAGADDADLLGEFAKTNCEAAFREIVRRYGGLVYHSANRRVRDAHAAEDIAQGVFLALSQKASRLNKNTSLAGWLFRATQLAASAHIRNESRRIRREHAAGKESEQMTHEDSETSWDTLSTIIDQAIDRLPSLDQQVILARYFAGKPHSEIAAIIGVSEDASKMRIARALEKLRKLLAPFGVTTTALGLSTALTNHAAGPISGALHESLARIGAQSFVASGTILSAAQNVANFMAYSKLKTVGLLAIAFLLGGVGGQTIPQLFHRNSPIAAPAPPPEIHEAIVAAPASSTRNDEELLKLRGEVARLRAETASKPTDSEETKAVLLGKRVSELKRYLENPGEKIPELQLLEDAEYWREVLTWPDLLSEPEQAHIDTMAGMLRTRAKNLFSQELGRTLNRFIQERNVLPVSMDDLVPSLPKDLTLDMLARYSISPTASLSAPDEAIVVENPFTNRSQYEARNFVGRYENWYEKIDPAGNSHRGEHSYNRPKSETK